VSTHQNCSSNTEILDEDQVEWIVYLALCADGTIYIGITTDLARREYEHNYTNRGAKYTRSRRPVKLKEIKKCNSKSKALRLEIAIKKMKKSEKLKL
jgi:putative endonuclease